MSIFDSPAVVALITVLGSALSTWGAVILNRRVNTPLSEQTLAELQKRIAENNAIVKEQER